MRKLPKRTMTLNLNEREMVFLQRLAEEMQMSKTSVIRQSFCLYQSIHERAKKGHKMMFFDENGKNVTTISDIFGPKQFIADQPVGTTNEQR